MGGCCWEASYSTLLDLCDYELLRNCEGKVSQGCWGKVSVVMTQNGCSSVKSIQVPILLSFKKVRLNSPVHHWISSLRTECVKYVSYKQIFPTERLWQERNKESCSSSASIWNACASSMLDSSCLPPEIGDLVAPTGIQAPATYFRRFERQ